MRRDTTIINPRQLYIELGVDELKKLNCPQLGISHFYEFSLGQGKTHELKAVPDGSIDLLFNIGSDKVTTYISGTVFSVKDWNLGDADLCFGVRFQPGQGILPKDLTMWKLMVISLGKTLRKRSHLPTTLLTEAGSSKRLMKPLSMEDLIFQIRKRSMSIW